MKDFYTAVRRLAKMLQIHMPELYISNCPFIRSPRNMNINTNMKSFLEVFQFPRYMSIATLM